MSKRVTQLAVILGLIVQACDIHSPSFYFPPLAGAPVFIGPPAGRLEARLSAVAWHFGKTSRLMARN